MTFSETLKNNTILSNLPVQRRKLLESSNIIDLKDFLFDEYNVENISIDEKFYNADEPYIDKIPIIIEMNYNDFCKLVDSKKFSFDDSFEYFIETENGAYTLFKDNYWKLKQSGDHSHDKASKL